MSSARQDPQRSTSEKRAKEDDLDDLVVRVGHGDRIAFGLVYETASPLLFGLCIQILKDEREAEDVLHDVLVSLWRNARQYDPARASASVWLATIARNRCIDRLRELAHVNPDGFIDALKTAEDPDPMPEQHAESAERNDRLSECIEQLDERPRVLIRTAFFQGLSYSQLADRMESPLGSIKTWVRRALMQLRACLEP